MHAWAMDQIGISGVKIPDGDSVAMHRQQETGCFVVFEGPNMIAYIHESLSGAQERRVASCFGGLQQV